MPTSDWRDSTPIEHSRLPSRTHHRHSSEMSNADWGSRRRSSDQLVIPRARNCLNSPVFPTRHFAMESAKTIAEQILRTHVRPEGRERRNCAIVVSKKQPVMPQRELIGFCATPIAASRFSIEGVFMIQSLSRWSPPSCFPLV
jgi:hypothetical protein